MEYKFDEDNFQSEALDSSIPVLVDFYADWCGPCQFMMPTVKDLADQYEGRIKVGKVNVDEQPELASQFNVRSIPFFALIKDGKMVDSVLGAVAPEVLKGKVDALLSSKG